MELNGHETSFFFFGFSFFLHKWFVYLCQTIMGNYLFCLMWYTIFSIHADAWSKWTAAVPELLCRKSPQAEWTFRIAWSHSWCPYSSQRYYCWLCRWCRLLFVLHWTMCLPLLTMHYCLCLLWLRIVGSIGRRTKRFDFRQLTDELTVCDIMILTDIDYIWFVVMSYVCLVYMHQAIPKNWWEKAVSKKSIHFFITTRTCSAHVTFDLCYLCAKTINKSFSSVGFAYVIKSLSSR